MNYLQVIKTIEQKEIHPLYLLYGNEDFFIKDVIDKIVASVLTEEERDFNFSIHDMKEIPVEEVVEEAQTLPFFGDKRVILLRNCYFLTGVKRKEDVDHNLTVFGKYIENPSEETIMIVTVHHEKLDERKKAVKSLKKNGQVMEASPLKETDMRNWLESFAKEQKLSMTKSAKDKLIQLAGRDMNTFVSESQKLAIYAMNGGEVDENTVEMMVPRSLENNVFDLVDHVVNKRKEKAYRVYYDLLKQNEEPIKILTLLARQFRIILQVLSLKQKGYSRQKIASQLKHHPYVIKIAEGQSKYFNEKALSDMLTTLAEADYMIKTGKMEKSLCLELSISKIMDGTSHG